jgi:hypothetical protein
VVTRRRIPQIFSIEFHARQPSPHERFAAARERERAGVSARTICCRLADFDTHENATQAPHCLERVPKKRLPSCAQGESQPFAKKATALTEMRRVNIDAC